MNSDEFREPQRRSLGEALCFLRSGVLPDPEFGNDLEAVLTAVGPIPEGGGNCFGEASSQ